MEVTGSVRTVRRRPRARLLALLVLGVWTLVVAPIAAAQHRATHVHVTCEHGEEVELGSVTTAAAAPAPDRSIDAPGNGRHGTEAHHHHCSLSCTATIASAARPIVAIARLDAPLVIAGAPPPAVAAFDVLVDAPKTSPPG